MTDILSNEKVDISSQEHSEISPGAEDGAGAWSTAEKQLDISDDDFEKCASALKMDMAELKGWYMKSEYKAEEFKNFLDERDGVHPLHVAAGEGAVGMVDMLITKAKVDVNIPMTWSYRTWCTALYSAPCFNRDDVVCRALGWAARRNQGDIVCTALHCAALGNHEDMVYSLLVTHRADPNGSEGVDITPLHVASLGGRSGAVRGFLRAERELCHQLNVKATKSRASPSTTSDIINVNATTSDGLMALHWAVIYGFIRMRTGLDDVVGNHVETVQTLLKFPGIKLTTEDTRGRTALDLASQHKNWEAFNILRLKITPEVKDYNEPYYKDRQASVDAANAILVGAALIASVTFAAWLQPPLGYSTFYDEQYSNSLPAPPTSNPQYASFDHHPMLKWFWAFNSLSFFFAIATVMSGAQSVLPSHRMTVKQEVAKLQRNLLITSTLLALSMVFVLLAFAIAGVIVIPPIYNFRASMYFTIMVGGGVSGVFLLRLARSIFSTTCVMWEDYRSKYSVRRNLKLWFLWKLSNFICRSYVVHDVVHIWRQH